MDHKVWTALIGFLLGIIPGHAFGLLFPWWISGLPCYLLCGALWVWGAKTPLVLSLLCGTLSAAAACGLQDPWTPWIALVPLGMDLMCPGLISSCGPRLVSWLGPLLYVITVVLALCW